jgi:hypothetical protein
MFYLSERKNICCCFETLRCWTFLLYVHSTPQSALIIHDRSSDEERNARCIGPFQDSRYIDHLSDTTRAYDTLGMA